MGGFAQTDPIESAAVTHEEGNEGLKIGVKLQFEAFYGRNLLKRLGTAPLETAQKHQL
jgi:hypothetical protein